MINFDTGASSEEIVSQSFVKVDALSLEGNGYRQLTSTQPNQEQPAGDRQTDEKKSHQQNCTKENAKTNKKVQFKEAVYVRYETA